MKRIIIKIFIFLQTAVREIRVFINRYADDAVTIAQQIKEAVESPEADFLVKLTKTDQDDRILKIVRDVLRALFPDQPGKSNTANTVKATVEHLRTLSQPMQSAAYLKIASGITQGLAKQDKKELSAHECDLLAQLSYTRTRNKIAV